MLPRVAREYGQTSCAEAISPRTTSRSTPGTATRSVTDSAKPIASRPKPTSAVTSESDASTPSFRASRSNAFWKQAA